MKVLSFVRPPKINNELFYALTAVESILSNNEIPLSEDTPLEDAIWYVSRSKEEKLHLESLIKPEVQKYLYNEDMYKSPDQVRATLAEICLIAATYDNGGYHG